LVKRVGFQVSEELWNKFESAIKGEFDNVSEFFRDCMKEKIKEKEV
jgi:metal-responsive CopG/Arc/MetJ family transcriptional regulator